MTYSLMPPEHLGPGVPAPGRAKKKKQSRKQVTGPRRTLDQDYQDWWKNDPHVKKWRQDIERAGGRVDINDPDYDYRGAFMAGASPDQSGHWPSQFKGPNHPNRYVGGVDTITGRPAQGRQIPGRPGGFTPGQRSFLQSLSYMPQEQGGPGQPSPGQWLQHKPVGQPRFTPGGHQLGGGTPIMDARYNRAVDRANQLNLKKNDPLTHYEVTSDGRVKKRRISRQQFEQTGGTFGPGGGIMRPAKWGLHEKRNMNKHFFDMLNFTNEGIAQAKAAADQADSNNLKVDLFTGIRSGEIDISSPQANRMLEQLALYNEDVDDIMKTMRQESQAFVEEQEWEQEQGPIDPAMQADLFRQIEAIGRDYGMDVTGMGELVAGARNADLPLIQSRLNTIHERARLQQNEAVDRQQRERAYQMDATREERYQRQDKRVTAEMDREAKEREIEKTALQELSGLAGLPHDQFSEKFRALSPEIRAAAVDSPAYSRIAPQEPKSPTEKETNYRTAMTALDAYQRRVMEEEKNLSDELGGFGMIDEDRAKQQMQGRTYQHALSAARAIFEHLPKGKYQSVEMAAANIDMAINDFHQAMMHEQAGTTPGNRMMSNPQAAAFMQSGYRDMPGSDPFANQYPNLVFEDQNPKKTGKKWSKGSPGDVRPLRYERQP